jgi:hypothetical protein
MMSSSVAADVHHQPLSESIPEEQDIDADYDRLPARARKARS